MMHLCGFLSSGPVVHSHAVWRNPHHETKFLTLSHYAEVARTLERGYFDFLFFPDRLAIGDRFGGSPEIGLKHADQDATRLDPVPILGALAAVTKHLGLGATRSTSYDAPYNLAREFATLDHLSDGRAAWNVVTSMNDAEALNFGDALHLGHAERYDRADEFMEVVFKLWDSWQEDALILDRQNGIYADPSKVHYVDYKGKWFKSRGPLNVPRSPQGRPIIIQAGASGRGKEFAARWSDVIFGLQPGVEQMRKFSADIRSALDAQGRPRSAAKVLMAIMPFVGHSRSEAQDKRDLHDSLIDPIVGLSTLGGHINEDFSTMPLDASISSLESQGTRGNLAALKSIGGGKSITLREAGQIYGRGVMCPRFVGTGADIAQEMIEIFKSDVADGFIVSPAFVPDAFQDFVDLVVPELQQRGYFRTAYNDRTLRNRLNS
jgi:FMN-dependent oxidoreductase (nitrilotriacetate monooxygenase family)